MCKKMIMHITLAVVTAATITLTQSVVFAQRSSPRPDRQGDYYSLDNSGSASVNWEVKSTTLNCRSGPSTRYRILTSLRRGTQFVLHTEYDAPVIQLDSQRKPWLQVKWAGTGEAPCYVRANNQFIVPIVEGCGRWNPIAQVCYCGVNEWDSQQQACVAE